MFFKLFRSLLVSLKEKSPPHLFSCFSFQSVLILLPIVLLFFCHLILHFTPVLWGAALLSIFIMWPGKKADRTGRSNHSTLSTRHTLSPVMSLSV